MDTSVKFSIEAYGVQSTSPTYKFGWCVCDPDVSPPKAVPQVCCTGDECQGQSSLRRCCVNPVASATDLLEHTKDQLFFYSKEEDGQECVFDLRKYKPQPRKIDILPMNSTTTQSTIVSSPSSELTPTSVSTPTPAPKPSSTQDELIQKISEHMCQLQEMKYDSELKGCIKAYPLDIISNCNDPGKEWEEFDEELNSVVCHIKYELNPPNGNFEIPAVLLPEAIKNIPQKSEKPLCKYQSYENTLKSVNYSYYGNKIADEIEDSEKCENSFLLPPPECKEACDVTYSNVEYGFPASFIDAGFTPSDIDTSVKFSIETIGMYLETPMYQFGWCKCNPNIKPPTAVEEICCGKIRNEYYGSLFAMDCCTYSTTSFLVKRIDNITVYAGSNGWDSCIYDIRKYKPEPGKIGVIPKTITGTKKPYKTVPGFNPIYLTTTSKSLPSTNKPFPIEFITKIVSTEFKTKTIPITFSSKTVPVEFRTKTVPVEFRTKTVPVEFKTETVSTELKTRTVPVELRTKTVPVEFRTETVSTELKTKTVSVTVTKLKTVTMTNTLTGNN